MRETIRVSKELLRRLATADAAISCEGSASSMNAAFAAYDEALNELLALLSQPAEQQDESWQAGYDKGRQDGANRRPDDVKQLEMRNIELQSELNEARTSIAHLLIGLDAVPKWISVEERLPEYGQEVIVNTDFEGVCAGVLNSYDEWFAPCSEYKLTRITHWMPLPAAPAIAAAQKEWI